MLITKDIAAVAARKLLLDEYRGVLSTHSQDMEGYPFGSVVPYCLDAYEQPIILISRIAQHTKNINHNPKVSIIVTQTGVKDVHLGARLTWIGDAQKIIDEPATQGRYYRFFPQTRDYHKTHDFDFYRINLVKGLYIGGFGKIFWLQPEQIKKENTFFGTLEQDMLEHMNQDHRDAIVIYCKKAGVSIEGSQPKLSGIDNLGIHITVNEGILRVQFEKSLQDPMQVRKTLIAMAS